MPMIYWASWEQVTPLRATVTLWTLSGEWEGSSRLDVKHERWLETAVYLKAEQMAACKGGKLDRVAPECDSELTTHEAYVRLRVLRERASFTDQEHEALRLACRVLARFEPAKRKRVR